MRRVLGQVVVSSILAAAVVSGCGTSHSTRGAPGDTGAAGIDSDGGGTGGGASGSAPVGGGNSSGTGGEAPSTGGQTSAGAGGEAPSTGGQTFAGAGGEPPSTGGVSGAGGGEAEQQCEADERVSNHECVVCPVGTTNEAGDDASGRDTVCDPVLCGRNEHVVDNACEPCPADGLGNVAGDDASRDDTVCDGDLCASNQYVSSGACVPCAAGTSNEAGDDATGGNTSCDPIYCVADEHVVNHACVRCPAGATSTAGDDAAGGNTSCDPIYCAANQHVVNHACVPCQAGATNAAGDDATGGDSACDPTYCAANQHVVNHVCVGCPAGATNAPGDDATGGDSACDPTYCAANQHVVNHACEPCQAGATNAPGDDATGGDTGCDPTFCAANQHVVSHACEPCQAGATNAAGDDATGGDTGCDPIYCAGDEHVVNHVCVACPGGTVNEPGDDARGPDTMCNDLVANYAFVSPVAVTGAVGGLSGADAMCEAWANDAGIPGTYRAILSTSGVDARDRLDGARGWIRPDGRPVGDLPSELFSSPQPLAPIRLGPDGADLGEQYVWSASDYFGYFGTTANGTDCDSWTASSTALAWYGLSDTTAEWLNRGGLQSCDSSAHLYCFQIDHYYPLAVEDYAQPGRILFVSVTNFQVDTGIAGADAICVADAAAAGFQGTYLALLADSGASAASRFVDQPVPIVRPDGLEVAPVVAALSQADLIHPASMRSDGTYYDWRVFTGASSTDVVGTGSGTCDAWSSTDGTVTVGFSHATSRASSQRIWFGGDGDDCASRTGMLPVYCLQE